MSVHQESLEMIRGADSASTERNKAKPEEVEYTDLRADSLAMFGAAVGGAILGMLLTLLVLALINGGTLNFTASAEAMAAMETSIQRVNENVGAVSSNVDIVAGQVTANQADLAATAAAFEEAMGVQEEAISANTQAISLLDQTRTQFDIFVAALGDALTSMEAVTSGAAEAE